jgi:hypothetical protein
MRKTAIMVIVVTVFLPVIICSIGCEDEQGAPNTRKTKLLEDENIRLTSELKQLNRKLEKQTTLLEDCRREKAESEKNSDELTTEIMNAFGECKEENKRLKAMMK